MCFTVNVNIVREELEKQFNRKFEGEIEYTPSYYYHAFSFPFLPVVLKDSIEVMQWGLIPEWISGRAEADDIRTKTLNARGETINKKPAFAKSFETKRCIVPVAGFFEWQKVEGKKIPWYISPSDNNIMSLAGLWSEWRERDDSEPGRTFTVVTTAANSLMARIHNTQKRMPLILGEEEEKKWLHDSCCGDLSDLLRPLSGDKIKAHTIGPLISSKRSKKNSNKIIEPHVWHVTGTLFD